MARVYGFAAWLSHSLGASLLVVSCLFAPTGSASADPGPALVSSSAYLCISCDAGCKAKGTDCDAIMPGCGHCECTYFSSTATYGCTPI